MPATSGERAQRTGDFHCARCGEKVHVKQGDRIPECPNCGNDAFDARTGEPGTKGSTRSPARRHSSPRPGRREEREEGPPETYPWAV